MYNYLVNRTVVIVAAIVLSAVALALVSTFRKASQDAVAAQARASRTQFSQPAPPPPLVPGTTLASQAAPKLGALMSARGADPANRLHSEDVIQAYGQPDLLHTETQLGSVTKYYVYRYGDGSDLIVQVTPDDQVYQVYTNNRDIPNFTAPYVPGK